MVLFFRCIKGRYVHGKCGPSCPEVKELIQTIGRQFGGVGVNCHQPFGSKRLTCPYDPGNPSAYQPIFEGPGDQNYFGEFECEPSDSIEAEADPIPDASQFLSPDQISRIEQLSTYDQSEPKSPEEGIQIANLDGFSPISASVDDLQPLNPGLSNLFDESISGSQMDSDVIPDMADNLINDQVIPSDESVDYSLFPDAYLVG